MKNILHNFKRISAITLAVIICISSLLTASAASGGSWKQNAKGWWYEYSDGTYEKGWATIDGNRYYFDTNNGYAATGWKQIRNKWYLFDSKSCAMLTGWQKSGNDWYYLYKNGEMLTGWQKTDTGFSYFTSDGVWIKDTYYKDSYIFGIDVSKWQGDIDWQALKDEGVKFAFVRVGHGDHVIDPKFDANMKAAEKVGIPVGVYFYSEATNETESLLDAQFVIDSLNGYLVSYPVVIDVEDKTQDGLSKKTLGNIVKVFSDEIAAAGYTPMLYCNENWYKNKIDTSDLSDVYKWIARWNGKYDTEIPRDVWQVCETGKLNGIDEYVDFDFALTDFTKIVTPRRQKATSYTRQNGVWKTDNKGKWYEYTRPIGEKRWAVGWELIGRDWYYFDKDGYLTTGWITDSDKKYYSDKDGKMQIGWQFIEEKWYYFDINGAMLTGWLELENVRYYLDADGVMAIGWTLIDDMWHYFEESGKFSGHIKDDITDPVVCTPVLKEKIDATCTSVGIAEHYRCEVCGKLYSDENGENQIRNEDIFIPKAEHTLSHTDFAEADCETNGNVAYDKCDVCEKLFVDGVETGENDVIILASHTIINISEVAPQIEKTGTKAHQKCTACEKIFINGNEVAFDELIIPALPKYVKEWKKDQNGWWYQYADGSYPKNCWDKIDNKWYYFNQKGYMVTGWINDKGIWYYTDKSGAMLTNWQLIGGRWYYFNSSGAMQTGWVLVADKWYYLNSSGAMQTGWLKLGSKWYYLNNSGVMVTGTQKIGGKTYRFNSSGVWIA